MDHTNTPTLAALAQRLASGQTSARRLVDECLARIEDSEGEGARTFLAINRKAPQIADAMDLLRASGAAPSPFAGIPVSIKDIYDLAGETTRAGSRALADAPPAKEDAAAVARLKAAGFIVMGRTNMTEFAFSGVGMNPHYGTPLNPWDRASGRIPGGSSSGAAVSVADGMAHAGLGSDTGGSCRIPAALCGLAGYKPTARLVPKDGAFALSTTLDSVGPIARSAHCCAILHGVLSGGARAPAEIGLRGLRLAAPTNVLLDGMEASVASAFARALDRLRGAGAIVDEIAAPEFAEVAVMNAKGGFTAAEAYTLHKPIIERARELYDPRVLVRAMRGAQISAADYCEITLARADFIRRIEARLAPYDAFIAPTTPIVAPPLSAFESDEEFGRLNLLLLRNSTLVNMMDGASISVPMHAAGEPPTGLMISGPQMSDARVLAAGMAIERLLAS
ncbi:MAG: amidase [Beijerinckiaceae bacterium]|nr:amidase [Beijerinckiaceae bacterium]